MSTTPKKLTKAEAGRLGGNTTKARHGRDHYVRIGHLGFNQLVARRFAGRRPAALDHLEAQGKIPPARPSTSPEAAEALRRFHAEVMARQAQQEGIDHDQR